MQRAAGRAPDSAMITSFDTGLLASQLAVHGATSRLTVTDNTARRAGGVVSPSTPGKPTTDLPVGEVGGCT